MFCFRIPIGVNMESRNLHNEIQKALAISTLSMKNNGTSTQIRVGWSNQDQQQIVDNIMAVYRVIAKKFPGKFANIRSLSLRFGATSTWTVPIYVSYGKLFLLSNLQLYSDTRTFYIILFCFNFISSFSRLCHYATAT